MLLSQVAVIRSDAELRQIRHEFTGSDPSCNCGKGDTLSPWRCYISCGQLEAALGETTIGDPNVAKKKYGDTICEMCVTSRNSIFNQHFGTFFHFATSYLDEPSRKRRLRREVPFRKPRNSVYTHFPALPLLPSSQTSPQVLRAFPATVLVLVQLLLPWS